jgi:sugar lactone lactonase YvrE
VKTINADLLFDTENILGEGPQWHPLEALLYWVDIEAHFLYHSDSILNSFKRFQFDTPIGAFGFAKDGEFLLATGQGFQSWDGKTLQTIWNPLPLRTNVRMNDGKIDPAGRFWAGSIDTEQNKAGLYRLDPDGRQYTILQNLGIANGLDWSPDRKTMYFTDSSKYTIFSFDYDLETGAIKNQRIVVVLPKTKAEIVPDGLCVDIEGNIWSAHWNGWQVVRYNPAGEPLLSIKVPAQRVTSCCFGGEHGDLLFITTARTGITQKELSEQPKAGCVFVVETDTIGQTANFFGI